MSEAVVVKTKDEKSLMAECKEINQRFFVKGSVLILWGYWHIGRKFIQYEAEGWIKRSKGDETIKRVSSEINIHWVNLYEAIRFAETFPEENDLKDLIARRKRDNLSVTWTRMRQDVLPQNTRVPEGERRDELLSEGERTAERLDRIVDQVTQIIEKAETDEEREIAQNVRQRLTESLEDSRDKLAMLPKPKREESRDYLDFLKGHEKWLCIITGKPHPDPHHLRTRGAGGSDFDVVPLSREYHSKIEGPGFWTPTRLLALFHWAYSKKEIDEEYLRTYNEVIS